MGTCFLSPLSREDIDAVNRWHWPLTYSGNVDIFAVTECKEPEEQKYLHKRLADRYRYAYNTYRKYRGEEGWDSRTTWLIEVIARTADIDITVIPNDLKNVIEYSKKWLESEDEEEKVKLRDKCYKLIDIYIAAHPAKPGRPKKV